MKTNNMNPTIKPEEKKDIRPDAITLKRLAEYGKRHNLTPDGLKVVSYLYVFGPSGCQPIMDTYCMSHDRFFAALCNANGMLIMSSRATTVDVCITSRQAIKAIPESALTPAKAPVATEPEPVATEVETPTLTEPGDEGQEGQGLLKV